MDGNPIYTGHLPHLQASFRAGKGRVSTAQRALGKRMLARLLAAHDGTRDGVLVYVPWDEWDGYCSVVDDPSGG